ncbi:unnamed protein product, partial [Brugia timori]
MSPRIDLEEEEETSRLLRKHFYDGNKIVLPLSKSATLQLLNHWVQQAASGFMAAFASKRMKRFNTRNGEQFHYCSQEANSITKHAKCVVDLLMLEKTQSFPFFNFAQSLEGFLRISRADGQTKIRKSGNAKRKYEMLKYLPTWKITLRK